ncbi:MAG: sulfite exporter TauE/SafE family protein [Steroidobacteraceae bacterium]|jgi:uncharacterized membrane protein YfcA
MTLNWINCAAGFGVGALVGLTGVGGGSLMAPIMILLFGVAPSTAVGTDLWFAATTKLFGAWIHGKKGTIDRQILRRMLLGSLPAAVLTLIWLYMTGTGQGHNRLMFKTLGVTLILTSIAAVFRKRVHALGERMRGSRPIEFKTLQPGLTVLAGAILGFLVTFTSIGAGALGAVMLLYLYPLRLTASSLVGTDIAHAIPLTILAGTGHLLLGNVNYSLLVNLLLGSIPGIVLGSLASAHAPEKIVRSAIALMIAVVGAKMVLA